MMLTLMVSLLASAPAPPERASDAIRSDDPPIKLSLNQDNYFQRGDRARVKVRTAEDGYVVLLRSDAQGRVRVLFPLDPTGDDFVRGGHTIELRGRGDREAFYVDDSDGSGLVLAARSAAPFKFDGFVRGDHWDYRVLTARAAGDDKEQALLDIVQRMSPSRLRRRLVHRPRARWRGELRRRAGIQESLRRGADGHGREPAAAGAARDAAEPGQCGARGSSRGATAAARARARFLERPRSRPRS